ncbi:hypothetical protein R3P38DRAFT_2793671 [Favolaschia claudopus]|uniref:Uncharacterized protein n=1 Tax=Favolaschia claudopus TaxID=2862362 RepID=A0AAW0ABW4_9AGAR
MQTALEFINSCPPIWVQNVAFLEEDDLHDVHLLLQRETYFRPRLPAQNNLKDVLTSPQNIDDIPSQVRRSSRLRHFTQPSRTVVSPNDIPLGRPFRGWALLDGKGNEVDLNGNVIQRRRRSRCTMVAGNQFKLSDIGQKRPKKPEKDHNSARSQALSSDPQAVIFGSHDLGSFGSAAGFRGVGQVQFLRLELADPIKQAEKAEQAARFFKLLMLCFLTLHALATDEDE